MCWRKKLKYGLALACAAGLVACGDDGPTGAPEGESTGPPGLSVSEPVGLGGGTSALASRLQGLVYVSASPGTFPDGVSAQVTNLATGESVTTPIEDGGFDPIALMGSPEDVLEIRVQNSDGTIDAVRVRVPRRKPPKVVRTRPPAGQTDVVLNSTVIIVFSEPVDSRSVNRETIDLRVDGGPVAGTLTLDEDGLRAELKPAARLAHETTYTLTITTGIHDLAGDLLEQEVVVSFTTQGPVASVTIEPAELALRPTQRVQLLATLKDAAGNTLVGPEVAWSSSDDEIATVDANGLVTGIAPGSATITAISEGVSGTATVTVLGPLTARLVSAGASHTCAVALGSGLAYCWGNNFYGQLGIATTVDGSTPTAVSGAHSYESLSASTDFGHTCGTSTDGNTYCWGWNTFGQLGSSTVQRCLSEPCSTTPKPVDGGLEFALVSAGDEHTCALTAEGVAYCWGMDTLGQLGSGGSTTSTCVDESATNWPCSREPLPVSAGFAFKDVSAGFGYTCGIATDGRAYCWGQNNLGQLGRDSATETCQAEGETRPCSTTPLPVLTESRFTSISAGHYTVCALNVSGGVDCWGIADYGQLGDGSTRGRRSEPRPVSGGLTYAMVSVGSRHACGVTVDGDAYCWGFNAAGELGDGSTTPRYEPVRVVRGLVFTSVSAGGTDLIGGHSCGLTVEGEVYCWGRNSSGQLGDGSTVNQVAPRGPIAPNR